ncbi:MAG: P-II family nitrogen regulator [Planctomycetia bacterium]|nr:P-II family nitrogen regulator [Planctomycetia bacterium]
MRLVIAVIKPAQVESVRQALAAVQVTRLTVCDVHGYDLAADDPLAQEVMIEIAVNDDFVTRTVNAISAVLAAGGDATARLFVLPMHEAVQIYRAVRGPEAV